MTTPEESAREFIKLYVMDVADKRNQESLAILTALLARVEEQEQEIANYKRELLAASVDAETAKRAAYERAIELIAAIRREMEGI